MTNKANNDFYHNDDLKHAVVHGKQGQKQQDKKKKKKKKHNKNMTNKTNDYFLLS